MFNFLINEVVSICKKWLMHWHIKVNKAARQRALKFFSQSKLYLRPYWPIRKLDTYWTLALSPLVYSSLEKEKDLYLAWGCQLILRNLSPLFYSLCRIVAWSLLAGGTIAGAVCRTCQLAPTLNWTHPRHQDRSGTTHCLRSHVIPLPTSDLIWNLFIINLEAIKIAL